MKHILERLNRPQIRKDMIHDIGDTTRFVILGALIVCAVIEVMS